MDHDHPWSLKGVDEDAQDVARLAARRAGMSLGEWLNHVIRDHAAPAAPPQAMAERRSPAFARDRASPAETDALRRAGQATGDMSADRRTIAALDKIARWIDEQEQTNPPRTAARKASRAAPENIEAIRDSIGLIAARLKTLDRTIERSADDALQPLRDTLRHLERHLAGIEGSLLSGRTDARRASEELRDLDRRLAEIGLRIGEIADGKTREGKSKAPDEARLERIGRIETKLSALVDAVNTRGSARRSAGAADLADDKDVARRTFKNSRFEEAVEEIRALQRRLDGQPDDVGEPSAPSGKRAVGDAYEELRRQIAAQSDEAEIPAREMPVRGSRTRGASGIEGELRAMRETMAQTLSREAIKPVLTALDELATRVETSGNRISAGLREDMRETLRELARTFEASLASSKPLRSIGAIATQIEDLGRKLDVVAGLATDRDGFERLSGQIGDLHSLVTKAARDKAPDRSSLEKLESRIDTLVENLNRQAPAPADDSQAMRSAAAEFQRLVSAFDPKSSLDALEQRLDMLGDRIEVLHRTPAPFSDLGDKIQALDTKLEKLSRKGAAASGSQAAAALDLSTLEALIQTLGDRIDSVRQPESGSDALEALERQIGRLTEKLEGSGPDLSVLATLERSISDLFGQIESVRDASREAASDAVREALLGAAPRMEPSPAVEIVKREMADLRQTREQIDRRTQDTLEAVHGALEKVVERLASLEHEVTSEREKPEPVRSRQAATAEAPRTKLSSRLPFWKSSTEKPTPASKAEPRLPPRPDFAAEHPDLLEPGSGRPRPGQPRPARQGGQPGAPDATLAETKANFIAAARRAAQTAAAETAQAKGEKAAAETDPDNPGFLETRKKPILLGLAALTMGAMALSVVGQLNQPGEAPVVAASPRQPAANASEPARPAPRQETRSATAPQSEAERPTASSLLSPEASSSAAPLDAGDSARAPSSPTQFTPVMPPLSSAAPTSDPVTVGSIQRSPQGQLPDLPSGIASTMLRAAAAKGDPAAAYEVGIRLVEGRGVARDPRLAVRWLERAAAEGLAPAQFRLGNLHEKGLGVPRDPKIAKAWYQRAADKGNAKALHNLAVLLAEGVDGKPDYTAAATAFRKAAEFGVRDSQYNLAILYARGLGVPQSFSEAYLWLAVAAAQGDEEAAKKREDVAARLSPPDLVMAKSNVERFKPARLDPLANEVSAPAGGWDTASQSERMQKNDKARPARG